MTGSGTFLTDDAASVATAAVSADDFGTLAKGGRGNGRGGNGRGGGDNPDDVDTDRGNRGPGNGHRPDDPGDGPGRSHEDRVVGFVTAKTATTLTVNGITVSAAPDAVIRHGNRELTMADIAIGDHIVARGAMESTGLVAVEIKVQPTGGEDDDDDSGETIVPLRGTISALTPVAPTGCPLVTFMIGTTLVKTTATTTFDDVTCAALANGAMVEVTGTTASDGSITATKVELQSGPNEVIGTVFELTGTASCTTTPPTSALTFKVGATALTATTVRTTTATTFTAPLTCATLANGARVEVEGTRQADGSITAASVEVR
jgi:hypothetical protein